MNIVVTGLRASLANAIIDLTTGRPLAGEANRYAIGAEGKHRENSKTVNPRLTALVSQRITDTLGVLGSIADQDEEQQIDSDQRSIGAFDYAHRSSQLNGVTSNTFGFARPSNRRPPVQRCARRQD